MDFFGLLMGQAESRSSEEQLTPRAVGKDGDPQVIHVGKVGQVQRAVAKAVQTSVT